MSQQEGNGGARFINLMRKFGENVDMRIHIAKVTSVSPFAIRIEGDADDIEMDSLNVMQSILPHERKASIDGGATATIAFQDGYITTGDDVFVLETNDGQLYHVIDKVVR